MLDKIGFVNLGSDWLSVSRGLAHLVLVKLLFGPPKIVKLSVNKIVKLLSLPKKTL